MIPAGASRAVAGEGTRFRLQSIPDAGQAYGSPQPRRSDSVEMQPRAAFQKRHLPFSLCVGGWMQCPGFDFPQIIERSRAQVSRGGNSSLGCTAARCLVHRHAQPGPKCRPLTYSSQHVALPRYHFLKQVQVGK